MKRFYFKGERSLERVLSRRNFENVYVRYMYSIDSSRRVKIKENFSVFLRAFDVKSPKLTMDLLNPFNFILYISSLQIIVIKINLDTSRSVLAEYGLSRFFE